MPVKTYEAELQIVKKKFDHWRATREKRGKIPPELMAMIPPLFGKFSRNRIGTTLHLNPTELKNLKHTPATKEPNIFAEYSLPKCMPIGNGCTLEFKRENGLMVKISGLTAAHLQSLVPLLMGV